MHEAATSYVDIDLETIGEISLDGVKEQIIDVPPIENIQRERPNRALEIRFQSIFNLPLFS